MSGKTGFSGFPVCRNSVLFDNSLNDKRFRIDIRVENGYEEGCTRGAKIKSADFSGSSLKQDPAGRPPRGLGVLGVSTPHKRPSAHFRWFAVSERAAGGCVPGGVLSRASRSEADNAEKAITAARSAGTAQRAWHRRGTWDSLSRGDPEARGSSQQVRGSHNYGRAVLHA